MSEANTQWETVAGGGAPFKKFAKVGDKIAGKIIGKRQIPGMQGSTQDVVDLMTPEGEFTVAMTADLKKKVLPLEIGKLVRIEYTGTKPIKGKAPMKLYTVSVATAGA